MASKILLADDSITIQKVVNLTFADEGIDVVAVSNGEMAERRLGEINPDLVLADIFMPGKNGYELCEFIKQSPQFRNIPVVLLVGAFEPFDQVEARRVHADAHLTKPFESRTLVETVRKLITSSGKLITSPLASPTPTDEEVEASSPLPGGGGAPDTRPLTPLNIDLNAMRGDWPPAETPQPASAAPSAPAEVPRQAMPIETYPLDESVFGTSSDDLPLEIRVDSPSQESDFSFVSSPAVSPGQASDDVLIFEDAPVAGDDADPFKNLFSPAADGVSLEAPALQDEPVVQPSPAPLDIDDDGQFMVVDFDRVDTQDQRDRGLLAFDMNTGGLSDQSPGDSFEVSSERYVTGSLEAAEQPVEEASPGAIFAVDDPLGDVLMNSSEEAAEELQSQAAVDNAPLSDESSDDPLNIEAAPGAPEPPAYSWDQGFDISPASESNEALSFDESFTGDAGQVDVMIDSPATAEGGWGAAATGFEISDSGFHPIDEDEPGVSSETNDDFRASSMWSEQESRTPPIDIEAVSVEEPSPAPVESSAFEEGGRGEEFSPSPVVAEGPRAEGRQSGALELSPAMLDEIVRRVVAQMSDSVVKEIAWEVVPDCVERVIENLTRESLSKNH